MFTGHTTRNINFLKYKTNPAKNMVINLQLNRDENMITLICRSSQNGNTVSEPPSTGNGGIFSSFIRWASRFSRNEGEELLSCSTHPQHTRINSHFIYRKYEENFSQL